MILPPGMPEDSATSDPYPLKVVATEGQNIALPSTSRDIFVNLVPATNLNQVTLTLPADSVTRMNQRLVLRSSRQIAELDLVGASVIDNSAVMMSGGDVVVFFKFDSNTWSRVI